MRAALFLPLVATFTAVNMLACKSSTEPSLPSGDVAIVLNASTKGSAAFSPNPFGESFATRAKVIWVNADRTSTGYGGTTGTTHHLVSDTGVFDSGVFAPGTSFTFTFATTGTYAYHCSIHPTMVGTVTITP
jgi:plastocyanin